MGMFDKMFNKAPAVQPMPAETTPGAAGSANQEILDKKNTEMLRFEENTKGLHADIEKAGGWEKAKEILLKAGMPAGVAMLVAGFALGNYDTQGNIDSMHGLVAVAGIILGGGSYFLSGNKEAEDKDFSVQSA